MAYSEPGSLQPLTVLRGESSLAFVPVKHPDNLARFEKDIWLRAVLTPDSGFSKAILELPTYMLGKVDIWFQTADGTVTHKQSGTYYPYVEREIRNAGVAFRMPDGKGHPIHVLMRIYTGAPVNFTALLWQEDAWQNYSHANRAWYGLFFGGMLALFVYNLFFAFSLKDTSFLYYVAYMACLALSVVLYSGLAEEFLWPQGKEVSWVLMVAALGSFFGVGFVNQFLDVRKRWNYLYLISTLVAGTGVLLGLGLTLDLQVLNVSFIVPLMHSILLLGPAYYLSVSVYSYLRGVRQARFLILGMSVLLGSLVLYYMATYGYLVHGFYLHHVLEMGLFSDALLLSLALSDRVKFLTEEKRALDRKYAEMQKQFSREMINIEEAEKKRHASILHDSVGHGLLVIKQQLDALTKDKAHSTMDHSIQALKKQCDDVMHEVRSLSHELHPHILSNLGLKAALESVLKRSLDPRGITWLANLEAAQGLPKAVETAIYRIVQEALSNIIKYASASEVFVSLERLHGGVNVAIKDDGNGFDTSESRGGLGLKMMKGHVELLSGTFHIESNRETGTVIHFYIPCPEG
ncbi:sensor histidine kinase [Thiolapillus brandeum]|uniref:sensor histidine kinase n=1 Tax=Thiolapillus brandeum TaxID=1076588 RepID=UPI00155A7ED8|nr:7TM diverse intracellular signaling domain-containing protein [Thiolapillus brandeum]